MEYEYIFDSSSKALLGILSAQGAFIDGLHGDVSGYTGRTLAVADDKGRIRKLVDHTGGTIGSIEDRLHSGIIKDRNSASGLLQFPVDIGAAFLLGETVKVVVHDKTLV